MWVPQCTKQGDVLFPVSYFKPWNSSAILKRISYSEIILIIRKYDDQGADYVLVLYQFDYEMPYWIADYFLFVQGEKI